MTDESDNRIAEIDLDESALMSANPDIEDERRIAQFDLLERNHFSVDSIPGPYRLRLLIQEQRKEIIIDVVVLLNICFCCHNFPRNCLP